MGYKFKVDEFNIQDWNTDGWGSITYDTGFTYSSNVAATLLAQRVGQEKLLDYYTQGGWQPGQLNILGARPSIGKTAMALSMFSQKFSSPAISKSPDFFKASVSIETFFCKL